MEKDSPVPPWLRALYGIINPVQAGTNLLDISKKAFDGDDIRLNRDYSGYDL